MGESQAAFAALVAFVAFAALVAFTALACDPKEKLTPPAFIVSQQPAAHLERVVATARVNGFVNLRTLNRRSSVPPMSVWRWLVRWREGGGALLNGSLSRLILPTSASRLIKHLHKNTQRSVAAVLIYGNASIWILQFIHFFFRPTEANVSDAAC